MTFVNRGKKALTASFPRLAAHYHSIRQITNTYINASQARHILEEVDQTTQDVFCVGIGAMDGITYDPLYEFVTHRGWNALLIEPLPDLFEELADAYRGYPTVILENVAISNSTGERSMYRVHPSAVASGKVPPWAKGIASFYPNRNSIGGKRIPAEDWRRIQPNIIKQRVQCETLPNILSKHSIHHIDIFQIDTEGYDYHVLSQIDFRKYKPRHIRMEWFNLPARDKIRALYILKRHHYKIKFVREHGVLDLVAWLKTIDVSSNF